MQIYGAPPYYYPYPPPQPSAPAGPALDPLAQINANIQFYKGLRKELMDETKDKGDKGKKDKWSFTEVFTLVTMLYAFSSPIQLLILWKLMH